MASINKTQRLGLNLWADTDRPQRADFNSDNMILEQVLGDHTENDGIHLTESEKARAASPVGYTGYVGNGESTRAVTLPVSPLAAIVYCVGKPSAVYDSTKNCVKNYKAAAVFGAGAQKGVSLSGASVTVSQEAEASAGAVMCLNEEGAQYRVVFLR